MVIMKGFIRHKEELRDKIDKLAVMIDKLATRDSGTGRQFKPQIY